MPDQASNLNPFTVHIVIESLFALRDSGGSTFMAIHFVADLKQLRWLTRFVIPNIA